jgi:hypothetical protein
MRGQWLTPVTLATWEEVHGFKPSKAKARSYLKNTQYQKGLVEQLKQ